MEPMPYSPDGARRIRDLFDEVVDLSEEERASRFAEIGREDAYLRNELEALLKAYAAADVVLRHLESPHAHRIERSFSLDGQAEWSYRLQEKLGSGGMGVIYKAHDLRLDRTVALKFLPPHLSGDEEAGVRLLHEARVASALDHPAICAIHEVDESPDGRLFIVMPYYEGETLKEKISAGGLLLADALDFAVQVGEGLEHAHAAGVVHRDVKPANLLVTDAGRVKILDFGLAQVVGRARPKGGSTPGTVSYMSPEQVEGRAVDSRTDLWSLGVVLYEMLTAARPFRGVNHMDVMRAIVDAEPDPVTTLNPMLPLAFERILSKALAKKPDERYPHVRALVSDLKAVAATVKPAPSRSAGAVVHSRAAARNRPQAAPRPTISSIAVLSPGVSPADPDDELFAAGVHDGLVSALAQVRALDVVSRSSGAHYLGTSKQPSEIARELGVEALLDTTVHRAAGRICVRARLLDARRGGGEVWAQDFECALEDVGAVHNDVARAVAGHVEARLSSDEEIRLRVARPVNPRVYEAYLRGMYYLNGSRPEEFEKGLAHLHAAVEGDPADPQVYTGLAMGYITLAHGPDPPPYAWPRARAAAERAVRLAPTSAEAWAALADVRMYYEWDWKGAEAAFLRAAELSPSLAMNHYHYAWYCVLMGDFDRAITEHTRAKTLDPLTPLHAVWLPAVYLCAHRIDEALDEARRVCAEHPDHHVALYVLGTIAAELGERSEAFAAHEKLARINQAWTFALGRTCAVFGHTSRAQRILAEVEAQPPTAWNAFTRVYLHASLGDTDAAFHWLAHDPPHAFVPWYTVFPPAAELRKDPRWRSFVRRLKLTDEAR